MLYQAGRAALKYKPGKDSDPCDNCGVTTLTMYEVELSETPAEEANLRWTLCVTCRSHLEDVFLKHDKSFDGI